MTGFGPNRFQTLTTRQRFFIQPVLFPHESPLPRMAHGASRRQNAAGPVALSRDQTLLRGSDSNVYKKIRLETELKIEEAALIAHHFDISLNRYVQRDKPGQAVFHYPPLDQAFPPPAGLQTPHLVAHQLGAAGVCPRQIFSSRNV